jgi:hypothetical protein
LTLNFTLPIPPPLTIKSNTPLPRLNVNPYKGFYNTFILTQIKGCPFLNETCPLITDTWLKLKKKALSVGFYKI